VKRWLYWAVFLIVCLVIEPGCGDNTKEREHPDDEVHIKYTDDKAWITHCFQGTDSSNVVAYDITVPTAGTLSLRLLHGEGCFFHAEERIEAGVTRVAFHSQRISGKEILRDYVSVMLEPEEKEQFKRVFPDFEERCALKMVSIKEGLPRPATADTGKNAPENRSWVSIMRPYPVVQNVTGHVGQGLSVPQNLFRAKVGKPIIIYTWVWGLNLLSQVENLIVDEKDNLIKIDVDGKPASIAGDDSPVWALVLKFENK
jgi:hypothetical protein